MFPKTVVVVFIFPSPELQDYNSKAHTFVFLVVSAIVLPILKKKCWLVNFLKGEKYLKKNWMEIKTNPKKAAFIN